MTFVYVSLGSNLRDRRANLESAVESLRAHRGIAVRKVSTFIETEPLGPPGQGKYLNAAAEIETNQSPRQLLETCHAIESALGRDRRREIRWGPRLLDIDLLLYGTDIVDDPDLKIPHPEMHLRPFVLIPLAEIAPQAQHPHLGMTIQSLLEQGADKEYRRPQTCSSCDR